jgi:hypothetical protein
MSIAEYPKAVEIVWKDANSFVASAVRPHAQTQRELAAQAAEKMKREREAKMKSEGIPIPEPSAPTHRFERGRGNLIGDRVFTPQDAGFYCAVDPIPFMGMCSALPGTKPAELASHGVRNLPKLVPLAPLSPVQRARLEWYRKEIRDPSEQELAKEIHRQEVQQEADSRMEDKLVEMLARLR